MFNLSNNPKHHRFQYHPRNYDEKEDALQGKRLLTEEEMKKIPIDVIKNYENNRLKKQSKWRSAIPFLIFSVLPFIFPNILMYMERKYRFGGIAAYFLLILLCFIFVQRNKKKNV